MQDSLTISTTTDTLSATQAAAHGDDQGARVPAPKPDAQKLDGSTAVSFEHPRSERTMLLERLAAHDADLEALTSPEADSEQVTSTEPGEEAQPINVDESDIDMAAVRQAATEDAIAAARRYYAEQQQQHLAPPPQVELNHMVEQFNQGMQKIRQRNPEEYDEVYRNAANEPMPSNGVVEALVGLGATEAAYFLMSHPAEAQKLRRLPDSVAVARIGQLQAQLSPAARRQRSNAPLPISPVGGSATKSSVPLDQLDYRAFSRVRQQQEKNRYRGR